MITPETTKVYVRVDLPSRRVIGVNDEVLISRDGQPVFEVNAHESRLDYYVVIADESKPNGINVRVATTDEKATVDANIASLVARQLSTAKYQKAFAIKNFFDAVFISRFLARGFMTTNETMASVLYSGTDAEMLNVVQPLAIKINNAYNEWRHTNCQAVIVAMLESAGLGQELDNDYRIVCEDVLDTFLTEKEFDIAVYHR